MAGPSRGSQSSPPRSERRRRVLCTRWRAPPWRPSSGPHAPASSQSAQSEPNASVPACRHFHHVPGGGLRASSRLRRWRSASGPSLPPWPGRHQNHAEGSNSMARAAAVCVLNSLRASRTSKAQRNRRTVSGSASLDSTPRKTVEDVVDGEVPHPQWLGPVDLRLARQQPVWQKRHVHRVRRNRAPCLRPRECAPSRVDFGYRPLLRATSGTGSSVRPPSAAKTGSRQLSGSPLSPSRRSSVFAGSLTSSAATRSRSARKPESSVPLSHGPPFPGRQSKASDSHRSGAPSGRRSHQEVGDQRHRSLEKGHRDSFEQGRSGAGTPWRSDRSGRVCSSTRSSVGFASSGTAGPASSGTHAM